MNVKKAIAIGLLTGATVGLLALGVKYKLFNKPKTLQTNATVITEETIYQTNFNSEIPSTYRKITFTGNAQYLKQITDVGTQYIYRYNFTQIQAIDNSNPNIWSKITPITNSNYIVVESQPVINNLNQFKFTWSNTIVYDQQDTFIFTFKQITPDTNQTINKTLEIGVNINDLIYNNSTMSLAEAFIQFNGSNTNENSNYIVNEEDTSSQTEYDLGYNNGYQDGYNQAIEDITPNTLSTNYVINTINYNNTLNQTYYTATGNFDTVNPKPFNNNNNYIFSGNINITVTKKTYQDNLYNTINGYQTELTADFSRIYNETTDTEITQQNHSTSSALIYTETQPNGIAVSIININTSNIVMTASVSNENKLYVNQNFYTEYTGQVLTETSATPLTPLPLCNYNIATNINQVTTILHDSVESAYQQGVSTGQETGGIIPVQDLMLNILTMPFTFISQAFNVTLWPGTQYAFNLSNFIKGLIAISAVLFIIKVFTSGFAVFGNYTGHRADVQLKRSQTKLNNTKRAKINHEVSSPTTEHRE